MKEDAKESIREISVSLFGSALLGIFTMTLPLFIAWELSPTRDDAIIVSVFTALAIASAAVGGALATHLRQSFKRAQNTLRADLERIYGSAE